MSQSVELVDHLLRLKRFYSVWSDLVQLFLKVNKLNEVKIKERFHKHAVYD
jgi:hypothetical protein